MDSMPRRLLLLLAASALLLAPLLTMQLAAGAGRAHACKCAEPPPPLEALEGAAAVFLGNGRPLSRRTSSSWTSGPTGRRSYWSVELEVGTVWKGPVAVDDLRIRLARPPRAGTGTSRSATTSSSTPTSACTSRSTMPPCSSVPAAAPGPLSVPETTSTRSAKDRPRSPASSAPDPRIECCGGGGGAWSRADLGRAATEPYPSHPPATDRRPRLARASPAAALPAWQQRPPSPPGRPPGPSHSSQCAPWP